MQGSFITFLGDMLKQWIQNQIIRATLGKAADAATIASANVTGTAVASAWSSAAAATSLASFGANAIPASAGILETYLLTKGLSTAQYGMDTTVSSPTLILAGEAGAEQVSITPLEGPNLEGPQGAGAITLNISAPLVDDTVVDRIIPSIREAVRRGEDLGFS